MDVFSFGMTCLWFLFWDCSVFQKLPISAKSTAAHCMEAFIDHSPSLIEGARLCVRSINVEFNPILLESFFNLALSSNPQQRQGAFKSLCKVPGYLGYGLNCIKPDFG